MPTLYFSPGACSLAPHIVLEWIGKPYAAKRVKIGSPELNALNPAGAVPVLQEDDGWILTQNPAILYYLASKHPEAGIGGGLGLRSNAELHRWLSFFNSDVHGSFWPVFGPARYTVDESDDARQKVKEAAFVRVRGKFTQLNKYLADREWILDGGRSVVDAYAFPMIRWLANVVPGGLADFPHVQVLHDRVAANAGVKKVLAAEEAS